MGRIMSTSRSTFLKACPVTNAKSTYTCILADASLINVILIVLILATHTVAHVPVAIKVH